MKASKHIVALLACMLSFTAGYAVKIRPQKGSSLSAYALSSDRDNPAVWSQTLSMTKGAAPGEYATYDVPRTGTRHYLVALVDFYDCQFYIKERSKLLERYDQIFNCPEYTTMPVYAHDEYYYASTGCVSSYFRDQSFGQFNPVFDIVGPVRMSRSYAYYGQGTYNNNVSLMVKEICDSLAKDTAVHLDDYVRNGNIENLVVIFAGRGENYDNADVNTIWPQSDRVSYYRNSINQVSFACSCELFWDSDTIIDGIGIICHEFSHTLGLPDYYNNRSSYSRTTDITMGNWSLMDFGNYNNGGFTPAGYTAFEKYSLGWMDLEDITGSGNYALHSITRKPDPDKGVSTAYRLSTTNDNKFIILENHPNSGWYRFCSASGLMITAVYYDYSTWQNKAVSHSATKNYYIIPADNDFDIVTTGGDLYPYMDIDSATVNSTPQLAIGTTRPPYSIYGITRNDSLVSFYVGKTAPTHVTEPSKLEIAISIADGELTVTAPVGSKVTVHDLAGNPVLETWTTKNVQQIELPGSGIWIVRCGNITRKVRL
jgi:M6 family metalloprotease-like protein